MDYIFFQTYGDLEAHAKLSILCLKYQCLEIRIILIHHQCISTRAKLNQNNIISVVLFIRFAIDRQVLITRLYVEVVAINRALLLIKIEQLAKTTCL